MEYLEQIGASLSIVKAPKEASKDYYRRVAYSAIADWMQTAVFVGNDATSIVQLKSIVVAKVRMLQELSPGMLTYSAEELVEHLYTIMLDNGVFLHRNYYVRPAPHRLIGNDSHAIVRGMCPEEHVSFSGLAPYIKQRTAPCDIYTAFGLPEISPEIITEQLWMRASPVSANVHISEYLNTTRKDKQSNSRSAPPEKSGMLYGRTRRNDFQYDYFLISGDEIRRLSEDHVNISWHEYGHLHLMTAKQEQTVSAIFDGTGLVHVRFSFHLPQPDLRFLQYLSWPYKDAMLDDVWNFSLHRDLWPIVKDRIEFLRYKVVEKHA